MVRLFQLQRFARQKGCWEVVEVKVDGNVEVYRVVSCIMYIYIYIILTLKITVLVVYVYL